MNATTILRLLGIVSVLAVLGTFMVVAPLVDWALAAVEWVDGAGALGVAVFASVFAAGIAVFLPVNLFLASAGFLFGTVGGLLVSSVATTLGAVLTLVVGRFFLRDKIHQWMSGRPRFEALDRAISQEGAKMSLLIRMVPILPFAAVNYAFAVSGVEVRRFAFGTWLGMIPICGIYVFAGAAAGDITRALTMDNGAGTETYVMWGVGLVAIIGVAWFITNRARREMDQILEEDDGDSSTIVGGN